LKIALGSKPLKLWEKHMYVRVTSPWLKFHNPKIAKATETLFTPEGIQSIEESPYIRPIPAPSFNPGDPLWIIGQGEHHPRYLPQPLKPPF